MARVARNHDRLGPRRGPRGNRTRTRTHRRGTRDRSYHMVQCIVTNATPRRASRVPGERICMDLHVFRRVSSTFDDFAWINVDPYIDPDVDFENFLRLYSDPNGFVRITLRLSRSRTRDPYRFVRDTICNDVTRAVRIASDRREHRTEIVSVRRWSVRRERRIVTYGTVYRNDCYISSRRVFASRPIPVGSSPSELAKIQRDINITFV
jgi:hypothetical protein